VFTNDNFEQVTALIKELLVLNRAESIPMLEPATLEEVEARKSIRKRIRQELAQALYLRGRKKS